MPFPDGDISILYHMSVFFKLLTMASCLLYIHSLEEGKQNRHHHMSSQNVLILTDFFIEWVRRRGSHTHTSGLKTVAFFCNTTVLKSTHIDCTIYSSLYSKIQQGVEFCALLRDGLVSLKEWTWWRETYSTYYTSALHSTQFALYALFVGFHIWRNQT